MRRTTLVFIVIVGIAAAIPLFARFGPGKITLVTGLIGSEKAPYFADVRVQKSLTRHGPPVIARTAGSHELASRSGLKSSFSDMSRG
jgi:hypothetical protein